MRKDVSIHCFCIQMLKGLFCVFSQGMALSYSRKLSLANKDVHIFVRKCLDLLFPPHFLIIKHTVTFQLRFLLYFSDCILRLFYSHPFKELLCFFVR